MKSGLQLIISKKKIARMIMDLAPNTAPLSRMEYDQLALFILLEHNRDCSSKERVYHYGSDLIGLTISTIARSFDRDVGETSLLVKRAVESKWIKVDPHPDNGTWKLVTLSDRGEFLTTTTRQRKKKETNGKA